VLVTADVDDQALAGLATTASSLGDALIGVIVVRQQERALESVAATLVERGLNCLAVIPEDRLLAGPTPRELAEVLHASSLVEGEHGDEAGEFVMLGPVSADPGQPYFLQHGAKAVVNRFDKMDLHLAALATEPDCLILTGGQQPSPYLLDRLEGVEPSLTVLLAPDNTVRTIQLVDELYGGTRFAGQRKLNRAIELFERLPTANLS
jgi:BioD-like phosphotransacetylase family protein